MSSSKEVKPLHVGLNKSTVEIDDENKLITITGPLGMLKKKYHRKVKISLCDNSTKIENNSNNNSETKNMNDNISLKIESLFSEKEKGGKALVGTTRAILSNAVTGVISGFEKRLEIVGVGYRAQMEGSSIRLNLGFSHPVILNEILKDYPEVIVVIESNTSLIVKGKDKEEVGQVAALIRSLRPPEPYKGKGVKYANEKIRRKSGKSGKK